VPALNPVAVTVALVHHVVAKNVVKAKPACPLLPVTLVVDEVGVPEHRDPAYTLMLTFAPAIGVPVAAATAVTVTGMR
jgi:hypothetical protein